MKAKPGASNVLLLVDRESFPKKCGELLDLYALTDGNVNVMEIQNESPTEFYKKALELTDDYELVVPVTRNLFIRDRLRMEGVNLVICL